MEQCKLFKSQFAIHIERFINHRLFLASIYLEEWSSRDKSCYIWVGERDASTSHCHGGRKAYVEECTMQTRASRPDLLSPREEKWLVSWISATGGCGSDNWEARGFMCKKPSADHWLPVVHSDATAALVQLVRWTTAWVASWLTFPLLVVRSFWSDSN